MGIENEPMEAIIELAVLKSLVSDYFTYFDAHDETFDELYALEQLYGKHSDEVSDVAFENDEYYNLMESTLDQMRLFVSNTNSGSSC